MNYFKAFLGTIVSFLVVDAVWIVAVVSDLYDREVAHLLRETPEWVPAAIFYPAYAAGIVALAVRPALSARSVRIAAINGGMIGAIAYGTFTVTNFTLFEGWTGILVWTDIAWGVFITALAASCGYYAAKS